MRFKIFFTAIFFILAAAKISFAQNIAEIAVNLDDKESCRKYIAEVCAETVNLLSQDELPPAPNYNNLREVNFENL